MLRRHKQNLESAFTPIALPIALIVFLALALSYPAQDISPQLSVQERTVGTNTLQKYFLIEHRSGPDTNSAARGLVLILPGGAGDAAFLPFCANVLTLYGIPDDF